jgi:hypothetical protein
MSSISISWPIFLVNNQWQFADDSEPGLDRRFVEGEPLSAELLLGCKQSHRPISLGHRNTNVFRSIRPLSIIYVQFSWEFSCWFESKIFNNSVSSLGWPLEEFEWRKLYLIFKLGLHSSMQTLDWLSRGLWKMNISKKSWQISWKF